jgi:Ca2+-binding RTX toxin-like protein
VEALRFQDTTLLTDAIEEDSSIIGDDDAETLAGGDGVDLLNGGGGDDTLTGGAAKDVIAGDAGDDQLAGDAGDDILAGGDGNDSVSGGDGDDWLAGGAGADELTGGAGVDSFVFLRDVGENLGGDTVTDFDTTEGSGDVLVFSKRFAAFDTIEELLDAATESGGDTVITIDADNVITLVGVSKADLGEDSFVFA